MFKTTKNLHVQQPDAGKSLDTLQHAMHPDKTSTCNLLLVLVKGTMYGGQKRKDPKQQPCTKTLQSGRNTDCTHGSMNSKECVLQQTEGPVITCTDSYGKQL
jgi:hypothetical protein